jgi:transcription antitermination factor NusG
VNEISTKMGNIDNTAPDFYWFAVYVRSRFEFKVNDILTHSGVESFLAVVEKVRHRKDRKKLVSFPLFPGYVFLHIDKSPQSRLRVLQTKGVVRFVEMYPGKPEPIPEEQITSLQTLVENKANLDPYPYLKEGSRVRIRTGPFTGIEGVLIKKRDKHLLVLSVDVLQKGVALSISAHEVEKI